MPRDDPNTWLTPGAEQVDEYLDEADAILVERRRCVGIMADICRYHFGEPVGLSLLELGCGDGFVTEQIRARYPDNSFTLMDGSADMVERARERLGSGAVAFVHQTFEDYIAAPIQDGEYDFVYSAYAIHHLDYEGKGELYGRIFREMRPGGLFFNIDAVRPSSGPSERWQFRMWTDWINARLQEHGLRGEVGRSDGMPEGYKRKPENKPDTLTDQLAQLAAVGFEDVDCFYRYAVLALFGGTKP